LLGVALTPFRRNFLDVRRERSVRDRVDGPVPDDGTRRILAEEVVTPPVLCGADGSRRKSTGAIGADIVEDRGDARRAECALVGAYTRLDRIWWQRLVAVLASRSQLKHLFFLPTLFSTCERTLSGASRRHHATNFSIFANLLRLSHEPTFAASGLLPVIASRPSSLARVMVV
jgi:hypothetical protein